MNANGDVVDAFLDLVPVSDGTAQSLFSSLKATLPRGVEDLARDVYNYFLSPKQASAYQEVQRLAEVKPHKLLHPSQTSDQLKNLRVLDPKVVMGKTIPSIAPLAVSFSLIVRENEVNELDREWRLLHNMDLRPFGALKENAACTDFAASEAYPQPASPARAARQQTAPDTSEIH
ncbi:hypothetical protein HPB48_021062 [Haemaphysalis longicornis]|uniref:Uncharacterized protein n=1 Tax=Haemaphysalis longicornis TaxID=44386 RepID=A0A9J6GX95_HAELO|nr:hypothetical protein HPB48_021062 [Haemaphysalis longicornis]